MELNFETMPYEIYEKELLKTLEASSRKNLINAYSELNTEKEYVLRIIDGEACVYRDLRNGYDIEISGLGARKSFSIYVWKQSNMQIVHTVNKIRTLKQLKNELGQVVNEFIYETGSI